MSSDAPSQELSAIYQTGNIQAVHRHSASGTGMMMPIIDHQNAEAGTANRRSSNGGKTAASYVVHENGEVSTPSLVEAESALDDPYLTIPTVGTGMEAVGQDPASQARRRTMAFSSSAVQRRVLVLVDETDASATAEPQLLELCKVLAHWHKAYGCNLNVEIKLFSYIPPRSKWRYLMLQSPATARGKVCSTYSETCEQLKHRIQANCKHLFGAPSTSKQPCINVDVHVDSETATAAAAIKHIVKSFRPSLVLLSDRKDQASFKKHLVSTSQEVLIHQLANDLKAIVCVAKPIGAKRSQGAEEELLRYDTAKARPRTFICCVNTATLYGHLPLSLASAATMASPGDKLVIFAAYPMTADATGAIMAPETHAGSDWTDRIRDEMKATKDSVARLLANAKKSFAHLKLNVVSNISDERFESGLKKYVADTIENRLSRTQSELQTLSSSELDHNVVVVIGSGKLKDYFGSGVIHALKGEQPDRVRRQIPDVTLIVTPASKPAF